MYVHHKVLQGLAMLRKFMAEVCTAVAAAIEAAAELLPLGCGIHAALVLVRQGYGCHLFSTENQKL